MSLAPWSQTNPTKFAVPGGASRIDLTGQRLEEVAPSGVLCAICLLLRPIRMPRQHARPAGGLLDNSDGLVRPRLGDSMREAYLRAERELG